MQKSQGLNPINFVINKQVLENYECIICYEKSINLLRCKTCLKSFCNQCTIDQKTKSNKCPQRCTNEDFQVESIPELNFIFRCPFNSLCQVRMLSAKQFTEHDRKCQFITQEQVLEQSKKWQFKCESSHTLELTLQVYTQLMSRRKCKSCDGQGISRSYCRICDDYYCNYCRPLPIQNMKCPVGHQFIKRDVEAGTYNCDICELTPALLGFQVYDDFICNLGFCQGCFKNLPTFEHSVDYTQNMYNFCQLVGNKAFQNQHSKEQFQAIKKKHKLKLLPKRILAQCGLCKKDTLCLKECVECKDLYCFQCKKLIVLGNQVCELEHPFKKIEESSNSEQGPGSEMDEGEQKKETCYSCNKSPSQSESFYIDKVCKTVLCYECIQKLKFQYFDIHLKGFSLQISQCKFKRHPLFILNFQHDFLEQCCWCKESRIIKSLCCMCHTTRFFCAKCVPPNEAKNCYCLKPLKKEHEVMHERCLKCWQQVEGGFGCNTCSYVVCGKCYDT